MSGRRVHLGLRVAATLAVLTVLAQIAYPLTSAGAGRDHLTVATVLLFATASLTHAVTSRGIGVAAVLLVVTAGGGLAVEAVGVSTGYPFGSYDYADTLGPKLFGVPAVIPLAWTMMAWPAVLVGRRVTRTARSGGRDAARRVVGTAVVGGCALASWDLFLDPQMVREGHWRWHSDRPGLADVPWTNFLGWLVVATAMCALLAVTIGRALDVPADDRAPFSLYLWTYFSSVLANVAFFGEPLVGFVGGVAMGAVVVALLRTQPLRTAAPGVSA